jgi:enoyl-CoA hydratase/carnithine racemase
MSLVSLERDGALAVITLDNPPQNRINERMAAELAEAIEAVEASPERWFFAQRGRTSALAAIS